jgi:hypothetical protein
MPDSESLGPAQSGKGDDTEGAAEAADEDTEPRGSGASEDGIFTEGVDDKKDGDRPAIEGSTNHADVQSNAVKRRDFSLSRYVRDRFDF